MAFYKATERKSRFQRKTTAENKGGFEDEGSYRKRGEGQSSRSNGAPHGNGVSRGNGFPRGNGAARSNGSSRPRRDFQENRPYGDRNKGPRNMRFQQNAQYTERGSDTPRPRPYHEQKAMQQPKGYADYQYTGKPVQPVRPQRDNNFTDKPSYNKPNYRKTNYHNVSPAPIQQEVPAEVIENMICGRNPIREALKCGRDIEKLMVARGELSGSAREILLMAKERRVPVQEVDRVRLDGLTRNHQGMVAFTSAHQYSTVEDMLNLAKERNEQPFLVLLDSITDPHNLGAIIRSAECAGAHGVIVQERRAVGLTPAAVKASAGAVEYVPVARVINLTSTIMDLQSKGIWVYAADMKGENYTDVDFTGGVALVIGAEGEGIGKRVLETCDKVVSLPMRGKLDSLNASVAAGILLYNIANKR